MTMDSQFPIEFECGLDRLQEFVEHLDILLHDYILPSAATALSLQSSGPKPLPAAAITDGDVQGYGGVYQNRRHESDC